jgi:hypothetical protein
MRNKCGKAVYLARLDELPGEVQQKHTSSSSSARMRREVQARLNSQSWKVGVVLYPANPLFRDREEQLAVAHEARGRIMLAVVIEAQCNHAQVRFIARFFR